jgi:beta-lactam-binding protein with PASTA domain
MSTRFTALVIGLLFAGSSVTDAQAPRPVAQTPPPAGTLRGRAQVQVQPDRMPRLIGQTFPEARQDATVTKLNLQLEAARRPTRDQRPGVIVEQNPPPGSAIKPGMRVTVYVAVPPPADRLPDEGRNQGERGQSGRTQPDVPPSKTVEVPRVVTMQARDGVRVLAKRTLNAQEQFIETARNESGTIVDQKPSPGTVVPQNSTVLILVARRPPPPPLPSDPPQNQGPERNPALGVRVPLVEGMQVQPGLALVSKLNLNSRTQAVDTDRAPPGVIIDQNPDAGTLVERPFTVTVFVARRPPGPPPLPPPDDVRPLPPPPPKLFPMPDLVGRSMPQAERDSRVTDLQLQLVQQMDTGAGGPPNTIVRQSVPPGTSVPVGQALTVFVASGVAVPRVVQSQADAAAQRIVAVGLTPRRSDETSELTPGIVLRQVPDPGVLVARGGAVAITVAVPPKVTIPNVVGRTRADALQELTSLRLRPSPSDDAASPLPPEQVVSQVPAAGTEVVVGAAVRIGVAIGVEVPNLSGLSAADAQRAVAERGLSFEDTDQETDTAPAGQVFQQQPASGTRVTRGSRVLATVAVVVQVLVPSVVGLPRQRAAAVLEAAGLRILPEPDATALGRLVERQAPAANTRVARLTPVTLFVAAPPPVVPQPLPPVAPQPLPPAPLPPVADPALTPPPAVQDTPPAAVPVVQPGVAVPPAVAQPGVVQPPGQSAAGANTVPAAIPVQPLLPPWLLSLLVAIAAIGASTVRLWWPSRPPPAPPIQTSAPATAPPAVDVRPERGDSTLRLEVSGRSLISMDVRVRVERGSVEQTLSLERQPFIVEERRLYE